VRLDGSPAAANTITRKRAVFHNALGYAVELGLLPANPVGTVQWHAPKAAAAVSPQTVASPAHGAGGNVSSCGLLVPRVRRRPISERHPASPKPNPSGCTLRLACEPGAFAGLASMHQRRSQG
jgi:hypothetical protein